MSTSEYKQQESSVQVQELIYCKNCNTEFLGNYCNACGQKLVARLTARHLWTLIIEDSFDVNRGLIYTTKQLCINPGKTAADYINGKTKRYYSPLKYLILWTAVYFLISSFIAVDREVKSIKGLVFNSHPPFSFDSLKDFYPIYEEVLVQHTNLFYLGMIPFFTMLSYFLYRKQEYFLTELSVPYLYLTGQMAFFISILSCIVIIFGNPELMIVPSLILFLYLVFRMHKQLFHESWTRTITKSLFIMYIGQLIYGLTAYTILNLLKIVS